MNEWIRIRIFQYHFGHNFAPIGSLLLLIRLALLLLLLASKLRLGWWDPGNERIPLVQLLPVHVERVLVFPWAGILDEGEDSHGAGASKCKVEQLSPWQLIELSRIRFCCKFHKFLDVVHGTPSTTMQFYLWQWTHCLINLIERGTAFKKK